MSQHEEYTDPHKCCRCGGHSDGLHQCPYEYEINDNPDEQHCNCCGRCTVECGDDI